MTELTQFVPFSRVDAARAVVAIPAIGEIDAVLPVLESGRRGKVGEVFASGDGLDILISDQAVFRKIREGVLRGVQVTTRTIAKGLRGTAKAVLAVVLVDSPHDTNGGLFAKNHTGGGLPGRPPLRPYRLIDLMKRPAPRPSQPTHSQFAKMSGLAKAALPKGQADTAALYDPAVPAALRASVIHARLLAGNGVTLPQFIADVQAQIDALVDGGKLDETVAAALLRTMDPGAGDSGSPGARPGTLTDAGFEPVAGDYYDPTRAVPGHGE
jgi:hypothetical protein